MLTGKKNTKEQDRSTVVKGIRPEYVFLCFSKNFKTFTIFPIHEIGRLKLEVFPNFPFDL